MPETSSSKHFSQHRNPTHLSPSVSSHLFDFQEAAEEANKKGIKVISLTGKDGGELSDLSDIEIRVPHFGYSDRIQEIHIKVIHILILLIEKNL